MRELLIATNNEGKPVEMRKLLESTPFAILGLRDAGIDYDVEETAATFEGNAIIKAMTYGAMAGMLALGEDSGLEIDALHGAPGVYTKRYAEGTTDNGHQKIFDELRDIPDEKRGAQFRSAMAIYDPATHRVRVCEGIARGSITHKAEGTHGFGQDPIFRYDDSGKTGGVMTIEEKNRISHRARALAKAREILTREFV